MRQNRRDFFKTTAASAAMMAVGKNGSLLGASDRINVGIIGVGGQGNSHLSRLLENSEKYNCRVIAVSDVYQRRLSRARERCEGKAYLDYRKLLDHKDIDAVWIVTPDHWHSKMSIDAMEAGKHVYCEKPMTLNIEQALQVRDAVKKYGKVFQVGPNRTADDRFWKAHDLIRSGKLGKVTWAQGGYNRNVRGGAFNVWFPIDETAGPNKSGDDFVDWDMWLGSKWDLAEKIPWNPEHFFRFRKYWPYNGGVATDLLYHILAPLLISIAGKDGALPRRVTAGGGLYLLKDGRDIPDVFLMNVDYPGEFTINLTSVLTNNTPVPTRIYGQYGTIDINSETDRAGSSHSLDLTGNGDYLPEFRERNGGYDQVSLSTEERPPLEENFLNCIRDGGEPFCNVDLGTATMIAIKMGVEAYRQSRTMVWDAEKGQVAG